MGAHRHVLDTTLIHGTQVRRAPGCPSLCFPPVRLHVPRGSLRTVPVAPGPCVQPDSPAVSTPAFSVSAGVGASRRTPSLHAPLS